MIRGLGTKFHLSEPLMYIPGSLVDCLGKKLVGHKMRTGTGCQIAPRLHKLHTPEVDLTVALHCIFYGASGFCKGGWI